MRRFLLPFLLALALFAAGLWWYSRPLPILMVTSWAGTYGRAQASAQMHPYGAARRVDVRPLEYDGQLDDLARAVASHDYSDSGDVIDFELPRAIEACRKGLLERIDPATLPPGADGAPAAHDFVPGANGPCWVGEVVYSQVIVTPPGAGAARLADLFDLRKFPGRRALRAGPKYNLEMALLADGVAPTDIYKSLATEAGLARALAKLATLGGSVTWLDNPGDGLAMVRDGRAAFASTLNGDVFDAGRHDFSPGVIWDRQLYELDVLGVPKGDPRRDMALDYVAWATGAAPLAGVAQWVPLGPARRSAQALVGDNPDLKIPMAPQLPTLPAHFAGAFAVDDAWWADHQAAITPRWQAFLAAAH